MYACPSVSADLARAPLNLEVPLWRVHCRTLAAQDSARMQPKHPHSSAHRARQRCCGCHQVGVGLNHLQLDSAAVLETCSLVTVSCRSLR